MSDGAEEGTALFDLTGRVFQAQEKPDLVEHPERAPDGIEVFPELILKLEAEMVFLTLVPLHLVHLTTIP